MTTVVEALQTKQTPVVAATRSVSDIDLVRSYLRDIGRVPLLSHEQEITLGRQVQELMALEKLEAELESDLGEKPDINLFAEKAKVSPIPEDASVIHTAFFLNFKCLPLWYKISDLTESTKLFVRM